MLLLRTGRSLYIKIDDLNKSLKPLLSRNLIVMSIKSLPWSHGKRWSELHVALILPFFLLNVIYRSVPQILREDGAQFSYSK